MESACLSSCPLLPAVIAIPICCPLVPDCCLLVPTCCLLPIAAEGCNGDNTPLQDSVKNPNHTLRSSSAQLGGRNMRMQHDAGYALALAQSS